MVRYALTRVSREATPDFGLTVRIPDGLNDGGRARRSGLRDVDIPITDCTGQLAPGAIVTIDGETAVADEHGIAHFTDLAPGRYEITIKGLYTPAVPAVPGTPAADFISDTFTGSGTIVAHTADSGAAWADAKVDQSVSDPASSELTGGHLRSKAPNYWFGAIADAVPPTADYYVEAQCHIGNPATSNGNLVLAGRWDEGGFGTGYYVICFRNSAGNIQGFLRRRNGGGAHDASWGFPAGVHVNDDFTIRLDMAANVVTVSVDGTPQISVTDTAPVLQVGAVALHIDSNSTDFADYYFDSILSHHAGVPETPGTPASGCPDETQSIVIP